VANKSTLAEKALEYFGLLYDVERLIKGKSAQERLEKRRELAVPIAKALLKWLKAERARVTDGTATATAFDYSLNRWAALTRYLEDPTLPIGRVEMWRGGRRSGLSISAPFVWRCPSNLAIAPFPHPPRRTGRADLPHQM
jgi:hypothetical protein